MKKLLLGAPLLLGMLAVSAEPVYLDCVMTSGAEGDVTWHVALDEAAGTASYRIPALNVVQKVPAVFTADKVTFSSIEISRVDLSMVRTINLLGTNKVDRGTCKLAEAPPARKF
jgi:hypothetical protein